MVYRFKVQGSRFKVQGSRLPLTGFYSGDQYVGFFTTT
jgi:hypothetical protein